MAEAWFHQATKIVAIGRNYLAHVHELNNKVPKAPFWFIKPTTALIPSGSPHECPPGRTESHHEVELGVVIGKRAKRVPAEAAMEYVSGYCLALDMTDRQGQEEAKTAGKPWAACKGWDTSCPISEFIPTDRVPDHTALSLWLRVNDETELRQHGSPSRMIFPLPELIAAVTQHHTLEPGDILLTGTPEGVGPVQPGDVIRAGIKELGVEITTPVVAAGSLPLEPPVASSPPSAAAAQT